jgi:hypothetical protein
MNEIKGYVSKEKLSKESFFERLQWWYNDNEPKIKIVFWAILVIVSLLSGKSLSEVVVMITNSDQEISTIIAMIISTLGAGVIGLKASKNPKK